MCNRLSFVSSSEKILKDIGIETEGILRTSYNIAPTQHAYIIKNTAPDQLDYVTWGMIPHWHPTGKNEAKLIHARAESIFTGTSFRIPIRQKRCLVIVDSYYTINDQFNTSEKSAQRYFHRNGELLALAGVWDSWYKDDYEFRSFSIILRQSHQNSLTGIPVILQDASIRERWLSNIKLEEVDEIMDTQWPEMIDHHSVNAEALLSETNNFQLHLRID